MTDKYLIVGLGNSGRKYARNRHNVGFHIVEVLAKRHNLCFNKKQSGAGTADGRIGDHAVILAKPQKFMNRSGQPVRSLLDFYKIPLEQVMVIYDDLDLPTGVIRIRPEGGSGGHNGMKDIISHLGTQAFTRMRVGIDRPPGRMDPADYVLQDFKGEEKEVIAIAYEKAADAIEVWLGEGVELAMSRFNGPVE